MILTRDFLQGFLVKKKVLYKYLTTQKRSNKKVETIMNTFGSDKKPRVPVPNTLG